MNKVCHHRPVIAWLVPFICGIICGTHFIGAFWVIMASVVSGFSACWMLYRLCRRESCCIWPLLLFAGLGYLIIQPWTAPRFPDNHLIYHTGPPKRQIIGMVVSRPVAKSHFTVCIIEARHLLQNGLRRRVVGKVRTTLAHPHPRIRRGDTVTMVTRLRPIANFNNPGGFDYKRFLAFKGIWVKAYVRAPSVSPASGSQGATPCFIGWVDGIRERVADCIQRAATGDQQAVLSALLLGDRSKVDRELRDAFNRSGIGHLLAISGLHVGIVASAAFLSFAWLWARHRYLLEWGVASKLAAFSTLIPMTAYALLAGMPPSTQRALIMVSAVMITFVVEREHDLINTLAIAALVVLSAHPPALYSVSFQLSFSSVLAIICGLPYSKAAMVRLQKLNINPLVGRLLKWTTGMCLVSLWAMLGSLPWVIHYFHQVSLVGIPANIVMVPIIGGLVVPLGLLSVFVMVLSDSVALLGLKGCAFLLAHTIPMIESIAHLPWAAVKTVSLSPIEIACYYLMLWALFHFKSDARIRLSPTRLPQMVDGETDHGKKVQPGRHIDCRLVKSIAGLVLLVIAADLSYWVYRRHLSEDLIVTFLDVGHGNAAVLELPKGMCVLVDGGGFTDNASFDVGERIVAPFLWHRKINTVNMLILSHPNSDHLNGLIYIAKHFNVKSVWTNNEPRPTKGYRQLSAVIAAKGIQWPRYAELPRCRLINGVQFRLLYPPADFMKRRDKDRWRTTNNNSIVLKVTYGRKSVLFPGDISSAGEMELVACWKDALESDVLVVPHHGSNSSSTAALLRRVDADFAVISAGKYRAGFPDARVMRRLSAHCGPIFRTDIHGAIHLRTDGLTLGITPFINP